ncbi:MAG: CDP-alcohol phosphatidyltransferase family protein [Acidimicrobiia bacterium]|nr:CDP-alcohol phosphatidyltransferase family protein [Acidimicrobiia bacterium]
MSTEERSSEEGPSDAATNPDAAPSMFDGIWTIPNLITLLRLLCIPLFLYLLFDRENRVAAALLLGALGASDWIDGFLARRLGQVSEFGKVFDPTVDRLLFIVGITAILIDGSMPLWFGLALLAREVLVGTMMLVATFLFDMPRIDVTWLGKTATFLLMFAVPSFLLGSSDIGWAPFFEAVGWILGLPGLMLSYWTGFAYIPEVRASIAAGRVARGDAISSTH